jgi:hypothetical protein
MLKNSYNLDKYSYTAHKTLEGHQVSQNKTIARLQFKLIWQRRLHTQNWRNAARVQSTYAYRLLTYCFMRWRSLIIWIIAIILESRLVKLNWIWPVPLLFHLHLYALPCFNRFILPASNSGIPLPLGSQIVLGLSYSNYRLTDWLTDWLQTCPAYNISPWTT